MFSVLILTLNEERPLPRCLASLAGCDDIVVLDSGSTDRTAAIAVDAGARVYHRAFDTFASQRNHAQRTIPFQHPWVFHLDADEQLTPELIAECRRHTHRTDIDGLFAAPRMLWEGRWIPRCTDFPAWQARFVRAPEFSFIDAGHGQREAPTMRMEKLRTNYLHDLSVGGEAAWIEKHRAYARAEARAYLAGSMSVSRSELFSANRLSRRRALKSLSHVVPARGALRFVYQYVLRCGFLDGRPGFRYCQLLARYEGFIASELRVARKNSRH